jgi:hypothetical protein
MRRSLRFVVASKIKPAALRALSMVGVLLGACASYGPVGVDPDRSFSGLREIVNDLPDGGTVDIFLVHGMRADALQTYADVIGALAGRLPLGTESPSSDAQPRKLVALAPTVSMDGIAVFNAANWDAYRPQVTIRRFQSAGGNKHINLYLFEYWQALAYMKCKFVIAPDTRVVGASSRSSYCSDKYQDAGATRLSSSSEFGNRWIKTEIMEWGLADATIATSSYRAVLHQAVREMLAIAVREAREQVGLDADTHDATGADELQRLAASGKTRFAFISESLGSYVVHDALTQAVYGSSAAAQEAHALQPDAQARRLEAIAPMAVICGASQVHMFANQLALLRFSELQVSDANGQAVTATATSPAPPPPGPSEDSRSHFFRGCPPAADAAGAAPAAGHFGAQQIVAYHEPNDLLTYYTSDRPGIVGAQNHNTINVVVAFTTKWVWFLAADPAKAHTGQPGKPVLMDMVACGRQVGKAPSCSR